MEIHKSRPNIVKVILSVDDGPETVRYISGLSVVEVLDQTGLGVDEKPSKPKRKYQSRAKRAEALEHEAPIIPETVEPPAPRQDKPKKTWAE